MRDIIKFYKVSEIHRFEKTLLNLVIFIEMTNKPSQNYNPDKKETDYTYNYDRFSKISENLKYPMVGSVFLKQSSLINNVWVKKVATLLLRIHSNQTMYDVANVLCSCTTTKMTPVHTVLTMSSKSEVPVIAHRVRKRHIGSGVGKRRIGSGTDQELTR